MSTDPWIGQVFGGKYRIDKKIGAKPIYNRL